MSENTQTPPTELTVEDRLAALEAKAEALAAENATLKAATLAAASEKETKPVLHKDPVKVGGKTYKFAFPAANIPGLGKITSEEASIDDETLKKIIAIEGQSFLVEQK